jgi:hypothetical protein
MFDVSCLYGTPEFATIQNDAFNVWNSCPELDPLNAHIAQEMQNQFNLTVDGQHYFANQNGALEAIWDLTSSGPFAGNSGAIVFAHKIQTAASPDGDNNILWVELTKDSGELANTVYRVNTVQGQPPGSVSSSRLVLVLFNQHNTFYSAPQEMQQVSSMPQSTVRLHDMMISAWPRLTCGLSSASLKWLALH